MWGAHNAREGEKSRQNRTEQEGREHGSEGATQLEPAPWGHKSRPGVEGRLG